MHKIAIVDLTSIYGGGEKFIADVFFPLESNFEMHYLLRNSDLFNQCNETNKAFLPSSRIDALNAINSYLLNNKIDLVILNGNGAIYLIPFIKCHYKIAYKHTGWQSVEGIYKKIIYFIAINIAYLFSSKIIAVSQSVSPSFLWKRKTVIIYNGVDFQKFNPNHTKNSKILRIIYVGRIYKQKGIYELYKAVKNLSNNYTFKMMFVGEGPDLNSLKKQVEFDNLGNIFEFIGFTNNVKYYLNISQIFILPSYYEACPLSLLEAMSMGLPVAAGNKGGATEIIQDGENGLLFNPYNVNEITEKLEQLLKSEKLRHKLGNNGRNTILQKFSINSTIDKVSYQISKLINK